MAPFALGIDGGGSKTAAWLTACDAAQDDQPIAHSTTGPSNPQAVGWETALQNLDRVVDAVLAKAEIQPSAVAAACVTVAGAGRQSDQERLRLWALNRALANKLLITSDAEPVLAAGTNEGWGVALIAGTGSLAYGRNKQGDSRRCGGWGHLLGDEGSGYWIGVAALRGVARSADGRAAPTELSQRLLDALGLSEPSQLIPAIYGEQCSRAAIASLASLVVEAANEGDEGAARIIGAAGHELAELVGALVTRLHLPKSDFPLALAGGLLVNSDRMREELLFRITQQGLSLSRVQTVPEPVAGAARLARQLCDSQGI